MRRSRARFRNTSCGSFHHLHASVSPIILGRVIDDMTGESGRLWNSRNCYLTPVAFTLGNGFYIKRGMMNDVKYCEGERVWHGPWIDRVFYWLTREPFTMLGNRKNAKIYWFSKRIITRRDAWLIGCVTLASSTANATPGRAVQSVKSTLPPVLFLPVLFAQLDWQPAKLVLRPTCRDVK